MGWGGKRPGSGRKKGKRLPGQRVQAARARWKTARIDAKLDAATSARAWLDTHEDAILGELLEKGDPRTLLECWKVMKAYAEGPPRQRIEVSLGPSPLQILEEIAARRRQIVEVRAISRGLDTHTAHQIPQENPYVCA